MKEMIERIGSQRPARFAIAAFTSGFSQMSLAVNTAFITFRGIYEWTRVPMVLLPSANCFQKAWAYTYSMASSITYVRCTSTTCLFLGQTMKTF